MTHTSPDPERSILLSLDELMALPPSSRQLPDLSVSNDALRESLKPPPPVPLGTHMARLASARSNRVLWWYGTRPAWLQITLGGMAGSLLGLGVVLGYYVSTLPEEAPEIAAESSGAGLGAALLTSAAPAISERVVQALAPASADLDPAAVDAPAAAEAPAEADAPADSDDTADKGTSKSERRKSTRRRASKAQSSSALPSWVQQHVKPRARRATLRDQRAAAREKKAARARARKARAKARALAQK